MFQLIQAPLLEEPLQKGDTVAVLAPGSLKNAKCLKAVEDYLSSLDLNFRSCTVKEHPLYSAPDPDRLNDFLTAIGDKSVKAIWALYGGYGTTRLLPFLQERPLKKEKLFIGFSDVTALLIYVSQAWGWKPIHGPMLAQIVEHRLDEMSQTSIEDLIFGRQRETRVPSLTPLNTCAGETNLIEGPLVGGNLSLIQYSSGTFWQLSCRQSILFLEDVDERAYRIANFLEHLKQSGIFEGVKALVFGDFHFKKEPTTEEGLIRQVLLEFAQKQSFPVFGGGAFGHGAKNYPLQIGVTARITR